jgi:hypothetical protein
MVSFSKPLFDNIQLVSKQLSVVVRANPHVHTALAYSTNAFTVVKANFTALNVLKYGGIALGTLLVFYFGYIYTLATLY